MINIISQSLGSKKTRGPKKVAANLIKGLEKIGYPFVVNKALDSCERLWIHDDVYALSKIGSLPEKVKILIGPNLFVNPENIPNNLDLRRTVYLHPSKMVTSIWEKRGYTKSPLDAWPVGIDTEMYAPSNIDKKTVIVYFKNRKQEELNSVITALKAKNIQFTVFSYGSYEQDAYLQSLKTARYIIWLGGYESQGIAMEEAMSAGLPVLVLDRLEPATSFDTDSTAAPYFSPDCGLKMPYSNDNSSQKKLNKAIEIMEKDSASFHPRNFILESLTLEKQARAFVDLYQKHFGLSYENGMLEKPTPAVAWKGESLIHKIIRKMYEK